MSFMHRTLVGLTVCVAVVMGGCRSGTESGERGGEHGGREGRGEHGGREGRGEHDRDGGHEGGEGEESGTEYALDATYDKVRHGARLILAYDAKTNSFNGTVENTTNKTLERVRVEVHLSNGKELGPTPAAALAPGAKRAVKLSSTSAGFDRWTAHPEVGSGEHGHRERK